MPSRSRQYLTIRDLRGGLNDTDPPTLLANEECTAAVNVDWQSGGIAHRRRGSEVFDRPDHGFTDHLSTLAAHHTGATGAQTELWGFDADSHVAKLKDGANWVPVTTPDPISDPQHVVTCSFNGQIFIAYNSGVDRLHVGYDDGTTRTIYRAGLPQPPAPTPGAKSAGAVTDTRTYKVAWASGWTPGGTTMLVRSELSLSTVAVSLAAQQIVINRPAIPPQENITHWELYAASTDGVYYGPLASAPIATATLSDNRAVLNTLPVAPLIGANLSPPSAKYVITDGNRLLMAGSWEQPPNAPLSNGLTSRVWFTPVLGSSVSSFGDSMRIPQIANVQNNYLDLNEKDDDVITGMGQLLGMVYVFKQRQIWKLVPTGIDVSPYFVVQVSRDIGTLSHKSICVGEDENGNPSLYFLSHTGPYRLGATGLEFLGWKIRNFWDTVNVTATEQHATGLHYSEKQEIWWFVATNGANSPNARLMYDMLDGGFAVNVYPHQDPVGTASCQFSDAPGVPMGMVLKPYFSLNKGEPVILKGDTGTQDYGENFHAFITTKPYVMESIMREHTAWEGRILADATPTVPGSFQESSFGLIELTIIRDFGLEIARETISLAPEALETHVIRKFEASYLAGNRTVQITLGDAGPRNAQWTLHELVLPASVHQED